MAMSTHRCDSVDEVFQQLDPMNARWSGVDRTDWLFRGQRDAAWDLRASALRPGQSLDFGSGKLLAPLPLDQQCQAEYLLALDFLVLADDVGLAVPGDSAHLRDQALYARDIAPSFKDGTWPIPEVLQTLAAAQHHGVPTRLLDVTHNPLTALFFAAHGAREHKNPKGARMAVFAIRTRSYLEAGLFPGRHGMVSVPYAANPFIRAQEGFFLLDRTANDFYSRHGKFPSFDEPLTQADDLFRKYDLAHLSDGFVKLEILTTLSVDILAELDRRGYHLARLMPSLDNVAKCLSYRRELGVTFRR